MSLRIILPILLISALGVTAFAQSAAPTKANSRPAEKPLQVTEPFEKASVAEMAGQCAALDTEAGIIELEFFPESAPESVRNFLNIAALGHFNTTTFSRVVPGFVIQGGNVWTRDGIVTKALADRVNRRVPDEPNRILHERGIVSMAKTDEPNSATTNFFILVDKAPFLDNKFAAFGRVIKGMEVVDAINKSPVKDETPEKSVRIRKVALARCTVTR